MHIHTRDSPCGRISLEETLAELGSSVDGITITDHDRISSIPKTVKKGLEQKFGVKIFLPSLEISTLQGDILGYGIKAAPPPFREAAEVISMIHKDGGIAIAAHPFVDTGVGEYIYELAFDAIEVNGSRTKKANLLAKAAAQELDLPLVGGSDSHVFRQVGTCATLFTKKIESMTELIKEIKKGNCKPINLR